MPNTLVQANTLPGYPLNASVTLTLGTAADVIAAPASNKSIYVLSIYCSNTSATLTRLDLSEGAGGTVRFSGALAASGGGVDHQYKSWWKLPPGTALSGILGTAVTDVRVNVEYVIAS